MIVAILARPNTDPSMRQTISTLIEHLEEKHIDYRLDEFAAGYVGAMTNGTFKWGDFPKSFEICSGVDLIIVLGGDGTLLANAAKIPANTPVLAVNLGRLGFLTTTTVDQMIPTLNRVLKKEYDTLERTFVETSLRRNRETSDTFQAMNDVVLKGMDSGRTLTFHLSIDRRPIAQYRADGIIIATPTGSTAYSLAAGGPILYPTLQAMLITPICPHTLSYRPVVVPNKAEITISTVDRSKLFVDGRDIADIDLTYEVVCRISSKTIDLIEPRHMPYFTVLSEKLGWGK